MVNMVVYHNKSGKAEQVVVVNCGIYLALNAAFNRYWQKCRLSALGQTLATTCYSTLKDDHEKHYTSTAVDQSLDSNVLTRLSL